MNRLSCCLWCACLFLLTACGGGGGGGGEGPDTGPANNACDVLRPKILSGTVCPAASQLPIAAVSIRLGTTVATCSGSLITARHVVTAGHCLSSQAKPENTTVQFGEQRFFADRLIRHPGYREDTSVGQIFNDVAVIELNENVSIPPLSVLVSRRPDVGEIVSIFGYGIDDSGRTGQLRSGQMEISAVTANHFFALFGSEGSNTCDGDSGGPAILETAFGPAISGLTSGGSRPDCRFGDNSSFLLLAEPGVLGFLLDQAPGISLK